MTRRSLCSIRDGRPLAWVYVGDAANPYTVFDLTPGHHQEFPQKFLAGYRAYIHADGYAGYNSLYAAGATHVRVGTALLGPRPPIVS